MTSFDLRPLMAPRSIAVVGASQRTEALGTAVISNLQAVGYTGTIFPINPRYETVAGLPCYASLDQLPEVPDAVFAAIPAAGGPDVIEEAGRIGVRAAFVNASGYADGGADGRALQAEIQASAARHGMAICGPNNTGIANLADRVAAWAAPLPDIGAGGGAIITQSGSASMVLAEGPRLGGLAYVITAGNEAVVNVADYLGWVIDDERVSIAVLFLETIREPDKFEAAALRAADRGVPVVALKIGRSTSGQAAVAAHTGSLAGDDRTYEAFFRRCGIVRANDLDELIQQANIFAAYPTPPPTPHTVPITFSGGEAALVADIGTTIGLSMPEIAPDAMAIVRTALPPFASPRNPLDAFGLGFDIERFGVLSDGLLSDPQLGVIAPAIDAPASGGIDAEYGVEILKLYRNLTDKTDKRFVIVNNAASAGVFPEVLRLADEAGIPVLTGMRESLLAINRWSRHRGPEAPAEARLDGIATGSLERLLEASDVERMDLLRKAGVPFAAAVAARTPDEAVPAAERVGLPVVVKGSSPGLVHKSDRGLVAVGLSSPGEVGKAAERILGALGGPSAGHLVVQAMVERGVELIIGTRQDPKFGTIIVVGPGGIFVDLAASVSVRIGPIDESVADEMLSETAAGALLAGVRGSPPADRPAAAQAIARISQIAHALRGSVQALEVNPLIVLRDGLGVVGVDIVVE